MSAELPTTSPAGRFLKIGHGDAAYSAFVPSPLPPKIPLDHRIVLSLSEADRALGELAGLGRSISNPHLLIRPFIHREAVLSSRIEGTQADITDIYAYEAGIYAYEAGQLLLPGLKPPASSFDVREVLNYVGALEYGLERLKSVPVTLRFVRELHERLMQGVRGGSATPGEFRRSQNWIGPAGCTLNEATYIPPPVLDMQDALFAFEKYLHAQEQHAPLIRLAFIHYQFEAIHPFLDGNGRIGRLLVSLLLVHWGLLPLPLLYLSAFFEHRRQEYYDRLLSVSRKGAWRDWILFFVRGVAEQSRDAIHRLKRLQDLQSEWRQRLTAGRASTLPLRLMEGLFEAPMLTIPQAQVRLGVTYRTAQLNVEKLVQAKILEQMRASVPTKIYWAREIFKITEEEPVPTDYTF